MTLTEVTTAKRGDNVVDAGVEEVDVAEEDEAAAGAAAAGAAATDGGRGYKLDNGRLRIAGRRLPRAPCTVENAERCPPVSMMQNRRGRVVSTKNLMAWNFMVPRDV